MDFLGLAHPNFPFKSILRETPKDYPIGFFWNAFGNSSKHFLALLDAGFKTFRIQVYWSDDHSIVPMPILENSLAEIKATINRYTGEDFTLYISPSCEHAEKIQEEIRRRLETVKRILPGAIPVNNPWKGNGQDVPGYLHEYHGANPGKCDLASTDGTNIYDINAAQWVRTYGNNAHPCFLWGARFNLREISDPGQKPPPIKNRKAAPSTGYIRSILRLAEPKGEAPNPSFKAIPLEAPWFLKCLAEDDQELSEDMPDDPRENRPMVAVKPNVNALEILTHTKQVIGKLARYGHGGDLNGLTRYYSGLPGGIGLYGYEIANKAKHISGSEFTWIRAGKVIIGPLHFAFRQGTFRN
jgi:hypothetical protein